MKNKIAVILTCHNRREKTLTCLKHLYQNEIIRDYEMKIFLVDDGSIDGTSEAVSKEFTEVNIIKGDGSLYWNRGMYKAWTEAVKKNSDFYLWLNDDTFLYEDAIQNMIETSFKVGGEAIIVGSTCSSLNKQITTYGGRQGKKVIQTDGQIKKCSTFNGNFVLIPHSVYSKLGNLDFKFRHSFGDIEYGMRANRNKINSYVAPNHIGTCERHDSIIKCFSPNIPFLVRFKHFYSPLGMNPFEFYYMNKKYKGLISAMRVFMATHLRVLFPKLWIDKMNE